MGSSGGVYKLDAASVILIPATQLHADIAKAPGGPGLTNTGVIDVVEENNYSARGVIETPRADKLRQ